MTSDHATGHPFGRRISAHIAILRAGEWREVVLDSWIAELRRWRCYLLGHDFGPEELEYEDVGYAIHTGTWRACRRKDCAAACETWSIYGSARGVLG